MLKQEVPVEGFKRRAPNYRRAISRQGGVYPWVGCPRGRFMKIMIGLIGDALVHRSVIISREFSANGATKNRLYGELIRLCPWAPEEYERLRGRPLTPSIVYDRYHKMYYRNGPAGKGGDPVMSDEHYSHCQELRPFVGYVTRFFLIGRPTSLDEADGIS